MKNQPLVSVIVPAYNHELYVEEALQSVINQTYKNIELIIINDGSKDKTESIIKAFIKKNKKYNIKFVTKENEGVCRSLNKGLELASGDYVAFLASDDLWLPERLTIQIEFMEGNRNIGLVFCDAWFFNFNINTDIKWSVYKPGFVKYFINGIQNTNIYFLLLKNNFIPALTVLIRKDVIDDIGSFDQHLAYEDYDMWLRISKKYPIAYINSPLAFYRIHSNNISNNSLTMIKGVFQTIRKHFKFEPLRQKPFTKIYIILNLAFTILINRLKKSKKINRG